MSDHHPLAMNEHSEVGRAKTRVFEFWADAVGFTVLPGRYGGELNGDLLALGQKGNRTVLVLGMKSVDPSTQMFVLDKMALGPHRQLSPKWIDVVAYSLSLSEDTAYLADAITFAKESGSLDTEVLYLEPGTDKFCAIGVRVDEA